MGYSHNMDIVRLYFDEILSKGNYELLNIIIHKEYIPYQNIQDPKAMHIDLMDKGLMEINGIDGIKKRIMKFAAQFSNLNYKILDFVEENGVIMAHYKISMKHIGTWNEIRPTNLTVNSYGFHMFKFKDKKIVSITGMMNIADILTQLGGAIVNEKEEIAEYLESIKRLLGLRR
jgi:predicted ester cyclase